jgi:hypothetical protein
MASLFPVAVRLMVPQEKKQMVHGNGLFFESHTKK